MNVLFLDYDGVVNNVLWGPNGERANYNHPKDEKVNDYQSVQWISEFCEKYDYSIVVISSWIRLTDKWAECLINGGLRPTVKILGRIDRNCDKSQGIMKYLKEHPEVKNYIIVDDEDVAPTSHLLSCCCTNGFGFNEFMKIEQLHEHLANLRYNKRVMGCDSFFDGIVLHLKDESRISIKYDDLIDQYYSTHMEEAQ